MVEEIFQPLVSFPCSMKKIVTAGIDVGTYQVKVVVTEYIPESGMKFPRIIGRGVSESKGLHHGYIINVDDATRSIRSALNEAEKQAKIDVKRAYVSIGGIGLSSISATGSIVISRADQEITELDVDKAVESCTENIPSAFILNKKIIHSIPLEYKIDGGSVLGNPIGMKGTKLEVKALFVTAVDKHVADVTEAMERAGVSVIDVIAAPIAASFVTLEKRQKMAGCVLANVGAETLSIAVFENNIPISLEVFPIGSSDITNDIALGLRVPLEEAENIKQTGAGSSFYPRKKLQEIIEARLHDMFELIESHLKKIEKNGLLPAGIILTGGGSGITSIDELAKASLNLPSRVAYLFSGKSGEPRVQDSFWSVAYGLCIIGSTSGSDEAVGLKKTTADIAGVVGRWIKQFLP